MTIKQIQKKFNQNGYKTFSFNLFKKKYFIVIKNVKIKVFCSSRAAYSYFFIKQMIEKIK